MKPSQLVLFVVEYFLNQIFVRGQNQWNFLYEEVNKFTVFVIIPIYDVVLVKFISTCHKILFKRILKYNINIKLIKSNSNVHLDF